jgi:hypothetical protein
MKNSRNMNAAQILYQSRPTPANEDFMMCRWREMSAFGEIVPRGGEMYRPDRGENSLIHEGSFADAVCTCPLPLSLLALVGAALATREDTGNHADIHAGLVFLDGNTHVASVSSLAAIAFVLTDTLISAEAGVLASLAWSLAIAALLALSASLATGFGREVFLVLTKLMLEVQVGSIRCLARLGW